MSWEDTEEKSEVVETPTETEAKEAEVKEEPPKDAPTETVETTEGEEAKAAAPDEPEKMVSQKLLGKVAKSIREKAQSKVSTLEVENQRLRAQIEKAPETWEEPKAASKEEVAQMVQAEFLRRQDSLGRETWGQDYDDALTVIAAQNDPVLVRKIQGAASPAELAMKEAERIVEDLTYGSDPKKKAEAMKAAIRKELEAEMAEKLKARLNQPTDVQRVRAAGGDAKPGFVQPSWETDLPK